MRDNQRTIREKRKNTRKEMDEYGACQHTHFARGKVYESTEPTQSVACIHCDFTWLRLIPPGELPQRQRAKNAATAPINYAAGKEWEGI